MLKAGHKFEGPDGQGYILTRDVHEADYILDTDFAPYGGAPEPKPGEAITDWLAEALEREEQSPQGG